MSERLIIDNGLPEDRNYASLLGMPSSTQVIRLTKMQPADCEGTDRVVFIPNLKQSGPYPYQLEQINGARSVGQWIVYAEDADESVLRQFRLLLNHSVALFTDPESAKAALLVDAPLRDSCLLISVSLDVSLQATAKLLQQLLPSWRVQTAILNDYSSIEAVLKAMPCARLVLIGREPADFDGLQWPAYVQPMIVIERQNVNEERQGTLLRYMRACLPGVREEEIFFINIHGEQWRREVESGRRDPLTLANEPAFCILDSYGLPAEPETYRDAQAVRSWLSSFTGCETMAKKMKT